MLWRLQWEGQAFKASPALLASLGEAPATTLLE